MISFLYKHNFLFMRNVRNEWWMLDTKVKVFQESISWNDPETVFHEMLWKKNFSVSKDHMLKRNRSEVIAL